MIRYITTLFPLLFLLMNCQNKATSTDSDSDQSSQPVATEEVTDYSAMYTEYRQQLEDPLPADPVPEAGKVNPADEALKDTVFFVFRERLREIVARKDIFSLLPLIDENIRVSFGDSNGLPAFIDQWDLDSDQGIEESQIWPILDRILAMGGAFEQGGNRFYAPYVYALWPESEDAFTKVAITGSRVRVRSNPDLRSDVLDQISYDIVDYIDEAPVTSTINGQTHPWVKIGLPDEREGFVWGKYVYSPIDYRLGFRKDDGEWKVNLLVSGD